MNREQPPITIEVQPVGEHFPVWLKDALLAREGHALLVLYPNEEARSQALSLLSGHGLPVDTTHHLTLTRLVDLVHLDLKRPRKLQDGPTLFNVVHELTKQAAERGDLPLLFAPTKQNRVWRPYNTERILSLHRALMDLDHPWTWEEDPGARELDRVLREVGKRLGRDSPLFG